MPTPLEAELLVDCKNQLGECVIYNNTDRRLYWVDINGKQLLHCRENGQDLVRVDFPEQVGSFALDPEGNLLAALESGLFRYHLGTRQLERLTTFEAELPATRLNDGRCDRAGRFVVGGCHQGYYNPVSSVIRYDGKTTETLIENVALTNAIAFSPDGSRMYFSDSETQKLYWYEYPQRDNKQGAPLGNRHLFAEIAKDQGFADGSCVDADGNLWNARYYGGIVQQYYPDGSLGVTINVAADCVTCICFGGENLDTLYITSGRKDVKPEQMARQPHAGGLFRVKVPAKGMRETRFAQRLF